MTCPFARAAPPGPLRDKYADATDNMPNGDKCCGYCGSWDRDQYAAWLREFIAGKRPQVERIELSDGRHKIYVRREGIRNGLEGAIKVYVAHLDEATVDLTNEALRSRA